MVMCAAGIDAASYTLPYVAGWADGNTKLTTQTAERVITAARVIVEALTAASEGVPA